MGLDYSTAEFLFQKSKLKPLGCTLILGRQNVYMTGREVQTVQSWTGAKLQPGEFADEFYRRIGATELIFLDRTAYEGAQLIHDLNNPLPKEHYAHFDSVIDGGTLEHIFNLPTALKGCMEAVRAGGRLFSFAPANNMMGHGFYQLTPELFYRCLAAESGFEVETLLLRHDGIWFDAKDPSTIASRAEASTSKPASLAVCARRTRLASIFSSWPIQSDYATGAQQPPSPSAISTLKERMISNYQFLADLQAQWRKIKSSRAKQLSNPRFFRNLGSTLR